MKLTSHYSSSRRQAGILLTECLVYLAVFVILFATATAAFYFCWDHTRAVVFATNDIESALRAGERWRADVRAATGPISVETTAKGQIVHIPEAQKKIVYDFEAGEIRRQTGASTFSEVLLPRVKSSAVKSEARGSINAWRWELELTPRRKETHLPLLFTFEAVPSKS
jgi:hypothetical protein